MKKNDVLQLLTREDKWYLGGANRLLWAPTFPLHLDAPGYWDEAHYYNYELKPLFTWSLLDQNGNPVTLKSKRRLWNPACLSQHFGGTVTGMNKELVITEQKALLASDVAVSVVTVKNPTRRKIRLHFVAWTVQEHFPAKESTWLSEVEYSNHSISFRKFLRPSVNPHLEIACALTLNRKARSFSINLSEKSVSRPDWRLTPWLEKFANGVLPNELNLHGVSDEGLVYMALHSPITLNPGASTEIAGAFAVSPSPLESAANVRAAVRQSNPVELSVVNWNDHFQSVPSFQCSDEFINRYYWYRWYGLKLNTQHGSEGNYRRSFVCEGIGYFRAPISYSAPCHMVENRWMHDPGLAQGSILTFLDNQREDGGFRGYIDMNHYRQEMFYHANWGNALQQLLFIHPSREFLESVYEGLKNYASYFDRERDEEISGLYDIDNHYETGQEYMRRYTAVNPRADQDNWGEVFRLKGVDVTVYIYQLKRALAVAADQLGKADDAELWKIEADKIKQAVLDKMWDPNEEMFFDIDPATGARTNVKAATCFYPYFTDIVDRQHLPGLERHLFRRTEFWTRFPVPSSSADDEAFSPEPEWKGKRMNCPWNGRVWPMTNSHIVEALANSAVAFDDKLLRLKTVELVSSFIRMMFFDRDAARPNCFEHYHPVLGTPSIYRGVDDYQHSWINDLIIKYVCGIRPDEFSVIVDPFPFGLKRVLVDDVRIRGRKLKVQITGNRFTVWLDNRHQAESTMGKAITLQI